MCEFQNLMTQQEKLELFFSKVKIDFNSPSSSLSRLSLANRGNEEADRQDLSEEELIGQISDIAMDLNVDLDYLPSAATSDRIHTFFNQVVTSGVEDDLKEITASYLKHCQEIKKFVQLVPEIDYDTWFHHKKLFQEYSAFALANKFQLLQERINMEMHSSISSSIQKQIGSYEDAIRKVKTCEKQACVELGRIAESLVKKQQSLREKEIQAQVHEQIMLSVTEARRKHKETMESVQHARNFKDTMKELLENHRKLHGSDVPVGKEETFKQELKEYANKMRTEAYKYRIEKEQRLAGEQQRLEEEASKQKKLIQEQIKQKQYHILRRNIEYQHNQKDRMNKWKSQQELQKSKQQLLSKPSKSAPQLDNLPPVWDRLNTTKTKVLPAEFHIAASSIIGKDEKVDSKMRRYLRILYRNDLLDKVDLSMLAQFKTRSVEQLD